MHFDQSDDDDVTIKDFNVKIAPFSGDNTDSAADLETMISNLNLYAEIHRKNNRWKTKKIPFFLKGGAHLYWRTLPNIDKKDYEKIITGLRLRFGDFKPPAFISYPRLSKNKQGENETVQQYYNIFLRLSQNLSVSDKMLIGFFINGLKGKTQEYVTLRNPSSLEESLFLAKQAEIVDFKEDTIDVQLSAISQRLDHWDSLLETQTNFVDLEESNAVARNSGKKEMF